MKRVTPLALLLALVVLFSVAALPPAVAAKTETVVFVNGVKVKYAQAPVVREGATLVSARETLEAMGLAFSWDQANRRILGISKTGETTVAIVVGELTATINGISLILGVPAQEVNGRIMVPLRFISDSLGATLAVSGQQIKLTTNQPSKGAYYTGLPLEITNTYVRNRSQLPLTIAYEEYASDETHYYTLQRTLRVEPGQKGVFQLSSTMPGQTFREDYSEYMFLGRNIISAANDGSDPVQSKSYAAIKKRHDSGTYANQLEDALYKRWEKQWQAYRQELKKQLAANNNVPLRVQESYISYGILDQPEANISFANLTEKRIVAFDLTFELYDAYGKPAKGSLTQSHRFDGMVSSTNHASGETYTYTWDLFWFDRAYSIRNVRITQVAYSDGTTWKRK